MAKVKFSTRPQRPEDDAPHVPGIFAARSIPCFHPPICPFPHLHASLTPTLHSSPRGLHLLSGHMILNMAIQTSRYVDDDTVQGGLEGESVLLVR
jgi:hypothetical protein